MTNYHKELEKIIGAIAEGTVPTLLLHACCAPCSSYCLEYLSDYFKITVYYYNPNIYPHEEYDHRVSEVRRLIKELPTRYPVELIEGDNNPDCFYAAVKGKEKLPEGGERCFECYRLRLESTARLAAEKGFDYFTSTLSISPLKNSQKLNEIGTELGQLYGVKHLPSDFKKNNGYKRSIELSREYGLYRQNYCGCIFGKTAEEEKKE